VSRSFDSLGNAFLLPCDLILALLDEIKHRVSHSLAALLDVGGPVSRRFRDPGARLLSRLGSKQQRDRYSRAKTHQKITNVRSLRNHINDLTYLVSKATTIVEAIPLKMSMPENARQRQNFCAPEGSRMFGNPWDTHKNTPPEFPSTSRMLRVGSAENGRN
jgi:hypothetical protein